MRFYIFFLFVYLCCSLRAQPLCRIQHYSVNDGLSQGVVQRVIQDHRGFIWLATWNGLDRYDGYGFKNYKVSADGKDPLTSYRMVDIVENSKGDIWCLTYDERAFVFDTEEECFTDVLSSLEKRLKKRLYVTDIVTLSGGISWILCKNGYACRVDENKMPEEEGLVLYSTADVLKGERIYTVFKDSEGDEWILTDKGVTILGKKNVESDCPFKFIMESEKRIYLISTSDKLAIYDMQIGKLSFFQPSYALGEISGLDKLSADTLALSTEQGLTLYLAREKRFIHLDIGERGTLSNAVRNLYLDSSYHCWVIPQNGGVVKIDLHSLAQKVYHIDATVPVQPDRKPTTFFYEKEGVLWILPSNGQLCYYDYMADKLFYYYQDEKEKTSAYSPFVRYMTVDRQGNMWLVLDWGVDQVIQLPYKMQLYDIDSGIELRAFLIDDERRLWVGSKMGIIRLYDEQKHFIGYLSPKGKIVPVETSFAGGIYALFQDKDGDIWIGTNGDGLYWFRKDGKGGYEASHYRHDDAGRYSVSGNRIFSFFQDSRHRLWVVCYQNGINLVKKEADGKLSFLNYNNEMKSYPMEIGARARCMDESDNGTLLVGTTNGLLSFSGDFRQPEEIKFYHNAKHAGCDSSLVANDVMDIVKTKQGNLYLFSFTGGMSCVASRNLLSDELRFKTYTRKDGLISELVQAAVEDSLGNIWIIQENAVSKFDPVTGRFENYRSNLFRTAMKFSEAVPVIDARRNLIAGTNLGMLELDISRLRKAAYVPPINFTDIRVQGGRTVAWSDNKRELVLQPENRNVTFRFAAADYINTKDIQYAYRLKGLEKEWNDVGHGRSARYMNIPAGSYVFEVRSTDSDGVWLNNVTSLRVTVRPWFHETFWAWLVYALTAFIFIGIVVYILFYIYRLRHSIKVEQQLADIKLRFFTDISHELRTPLTLIIAPLSAVLAHEQLSEKARQNLVTVEKNAQRMLRMMNQILDFRKIQKGKMKLFMERIEIVGTLRSVLDNFSSLATEKHIRMSLQADADEMYIWTDPDKFDKIFFNLLSNAFKYTPEGKCITVRVKLEKECLQVRVSDQGVGIDDSVVKNIFNRFETLGTLIGQPSSGIGLALVKDMVQLLHGTIQVESRVGKGSDFIVTLPSDKQVFSDNKQIEWVLKDECDKAVPASMSAGLEKKSEEEMQDGRLSILIVEDNDELRTSLADILSVRYRVLTAVNGEAGWDMARKELPDMILTDVMMPVMDGLEMVRQLKNDAEVCHIPIIVLSAKASLDDRIQALDQGIDDYITKPFSAAYLEARIGQVFRQRERLQEAYFSRFSGKKEDEKQKSLLELAPSQPQVTRLDEAFMQKVVDFIECNMDNANLEIEEVAAHVCLSRTVFYRKLKSIVGMTPVEFIRGIRLKRAEQLIVSSDYTFSQIAYMTGFADPKYFGKCFKKATGMTPSEYKQAKSE